MILAKEDITHVVQSTILLLPSRLTARIALPLLLLLLLLLAAAVLPVLPAASAVLLFCCCCYICCSLKQQQLLLQRVQQRCYIHAEQSVQHLSTGIHQCWRDVCAMAPHFHVRVDSPCSNAYHTASQLRKQPPPLQVLIKGMHFSELIFSEPGGTGGGPVEIFP